MSAPVPSYIGRMAGLGFGGKSCRVFCEGDAAGVWGGSGSVLIEANISSFTFSLKPGGVSTSIEVLPWSITPRDAPWEDTVYAPSRK